jgi:hypothetical protein
VAFSKSKKTSVDNKCKSNVSWSSRVSPAREYVVAINESVNQPTSPTDSVVTKQALKRRGRPVYNKKNYYTFYGASVIRIDRHLMNGHVKEHRVMEVRMLPKRDPERLTLLHVLSVPALGRCKRCPGTRPRGSGAPRFAPCHAHLRGVAAGAAHGAAINFRNTLVGQIS